MPFLGNQPSTGYSTIVKDDFTANGNDTVFTLSRTAASANSIAVFVGNVRQEPTDAYTVNGTTLTMSAAPANGANFYVLHISGAVENSSVPASGTIGTSQLANNAVHTGKIADNQVTTAKIADDQITSAKLANAINITSGNSLTIDSGATITNNGSAIGFGSASYKILKLAFDASSTTYSTTSGSWQTTDLSISYVPVSASSTIIVLGSFMVGSANNAHGYAGLHIDGSNSQYGRFGGNFQGSDVISINYAQSTVSTSTKVIEAKFVSNSGTTVYFNTGPYGAHGPSYLIVMEVEYE